MKGLTDQEAADLIGLADGVIPTWTQGLILTNDALPDNPIIYASAGFATLTGYPVEDIIGRNCRFLQGEDTSRFTVDAIRRAIAAYRRFDGDILNYRKDGSPFWNRLSIGPLCRLTQKGLFAGMQMDVTDRVAKTHGLKVVK